jgi:hypothetical protein
MLSGCEPANAVPVVWRWRSFSAFSAFGAWAFNPDNGALLHNALLWHIFGIVAVTGPRSWVHLL